MQGKVCNFISLFLDNVTENGVIIQRYVKKTCVRYKNLESSSFNINVDGKSFKVEFKLELLSNDMKMLAFLAGESTNSAYYFSTFANVHKDNANVLDISYNSGKSTDWTPFTYQKN